MRPGPWAPLLAVALVGCAGVADIFTPAPASPPPRPAVVEQPPAEAPAPRPAPLAKEPPAPSRSPGPPKEPVGPPPAASASPPPPPAAAQSTPRTAAIPREPPGPPAPVLAPQASAEEEQRIKHDAERRIEGTEKLVQRIDPARLRREQQENYLTVQSFLTKAREALSARDVQRAFTLADKAYLLADELSRAAR